MAKDLGGKVRLDLFRGEKIWGLFQAIAQSRGGADMIAFLAKLADVLPDGRSGNAKTLGQIFSR